MIDHVGNENTRVFREITALGEELTELSDTLLGARTPTEVAVVFDWDNWWATVLSAGPSRCINYYEEIYQYYKALLNLHIPMDFVGVDDDLSGYKCCHCTDVIHVQRRL